MIKSNDLRERFLKFFEAYGHIRKESDSLIPSGDPTVLFTSAGMNQFKDYFLGKRTDLKRAVSCQKCLRTGDLERVGKTPSHHSFFEMLGNFSFGDYFKAEAIQWAWEFLTGTLDYAGKQSSPVRDLCLSLSAEKLWVSIYEEDEEAFKLWRKLGIPENRIRRFGQADNFWPANAPKEGPNGPCGPCSEIYYDPEAIVQGPKSVEVWNLVFTQYDRQPDGSLKPLPKPNIDTGMGLERLTAVVQGLAQGRILSDYETDLFEPIIGEIRPRLTVSSADVDQKVILEWALADHFRAIVFLLAERLSPSNGQRGYVLRMLIRRAHRFARKLGLPEGSAALRDKTRTARWDLIQAVIDTMKGSPHEDLLKNDESIYQAWYQEEKQFAETLEGGENRLQNLIQELKRLRQKTLSGEEAFKLYDTHGFPLEITIDIAHEHGLTVDQATFEKALAVQQERSRAASQFSGGVFVSDELSVRSMIPDLPSKDAQFIGYENLKAEAIIRGIWNGNQWINEAHAGEQVGIVLNHSPFYGEAGGQIGDSGVLETPRGMAEIQKTTWVDDVLLHQATIRTGSIAVQNPARASVDSERRLKVARSHTAAHLLHWALRKVLGPETVQAGSYVEIERVRFDFSSLKGLHEEQRYQVEELINSRIRLADAVCANPMSLEQAKRTGALALFGEKYGANVRVVTIGDYSKELCGGTHLLHTGYVGSFVITSESSIAAGTRRVEAEVGEAASQRQHQNRSLLTQAAQRLGRSPQELVQGIEELLEQLKNLKKQRKNLQTELAQVRAPRLVAEARSINGVCLIAAKIDQADREILAVLADAIKRSLNTEGIVVLAAIESPKQVSWLSATTKGLAGRVHAGELLKQVAALTQGKGGGRPDFAQGGGTEVSKVPDALKRAEELIRQALEST